MTNAPDTATDTYPSAIRVLHCIHSLDGGGAERQVILLANASAAAGMTAAIACVDTNGRDNLHPDVNVYKLARGGMLGLGIYAGITAAIVDFKPAIVHAWLPAVVTVPAMLLAARHRIPSVYAYRAARRFDSPYTPIEFLIAMCCADTVLSNTPIEVCSTPFRWLYRRKHGQRIDNGVVERTERVARGPSDAGPTRLLFAGRLSAQKNWRRLIDSLPAISSRRAVTLTIFGTGPDDMALRQHVATLGLEHLVDIVGYDPAFRDRLSQYDVLVSPSFFEGMPNVVLEAMAAGLPCVLSNIPEHREIVGPMTASHLFDPTNTQSLAESVIASTASEAHMAALSAENRARAARFGVENMAMQHARAYASLLSRPRA